MPRRLPIPGFPENQRPDERVAYQIGIPASYPSPSSPVCTLYELTGNTDVTATKLSGAAAIGPATINGVAYAAAITTPLVIALVAGTTYRLEVQYVSGGNTFEPFGIIYGVT